MRMKSWTLEDAVQEPDAHVLPIEGVSSLQGMIDRRPDRHGRIPHIHDAIFPLFEYREPNELVILVVEVVRDAQSPRHIDDRIGFHFHAPYPSSKCRRPV